MVHGHRTGFVVDLRIDTRIANQVDNPFLALVLTQTKSGGKIPRLTISIRSQQRRGLGLLDVYPLVDLAVRF